MCKKSIIMDDLLQDGFSEKLAKYYLNEVQRDCNNQLYDKEYVAWCHELGFLADSAYAYGLNNVNKDSYLSEYDYYKIWPINNWTKIWVNDKLTLKLILSDNVTKDFMPEYYFYSYKGKLFILSDSMFDGRDISKAFISKLKDVGSFACKPCNGSGAIGFFKLTYEEGKFFIDNREVEENDILEFAIRNSNYLFTEYLKPSSDFSQYGSKIHTLRIVVINENGFIPQIVGGYLRLPNDTCSEANYTVLDGTDVSRFNIFADFNVITGEYGAAKMIYSNHTVDALYHPNTNAVMKGRISNYQQLLDLIFYISKKMPCLEFIGFDIGVTDKGFKCMEINTLPGIKYMQIFHPFNNNDTLRSYFERKIYEVNSLSVQNKRMRNKLL